MVSLQLRGGEKIIFSTLFRMISGNHREMNTLCFNLIHIKNNISSNLAKSYLYFVQF